MGTTAGSDVGAYAARLAKVQQASAFIDAPYRAGEIGARDGSLAIMAGQRGGC